MNKSTRPLANQMRTLSFLSAMVAIYSPFNPAYADDTVPQYNFSLTGASNYIFRGVSQTDDKPAIFGTAQATYNMFYAGVGAENVEFNHRDEMEYDLSTGWKPTLDDFNFDLGLIRYGYINQPAHAGIDTLDFKGAVSHDFGPATTGIAVFYTPDYFGTNSDGVYYQVNAAYKIMEDLSASGAVGRQHIGIGGDYTTWNFGGDYTFIKNVALDLRYYDTDEHQLGKLQDHHFVAAIKAIF